jgi:hypothetical protein
MVLAGHGKSLLPALLARELKSGTDWNKAFNTAVSHSLFTGPPTQIVSR